MSGIGRHQHSVNSPITHYRQ